MTAIHKKADNESKSEPTPYSTRLTIFVLVVCLIGLGVAVELTTIHYQSHTNPNYESICAINKALNCETVARSRYSVFLGLPISVWGIFAYGVFIMLCGYSLLRKRSLSGILVLGFGGAFTASVLLAYISTVLIESLCLFCTTLYFVNTILLVLGIVQNLPRPGSLFKNIAEDFAFVFSKLRFFGPLGIAFATLVALTLILYPPYWKQSQFATLPVLNTGVTPEGHPWIGAINPILTVVEFSDYECPFCRRAHYEMRMMLARYSDEVRLVHKHMPMDNKCNAYIENPFHERACEFAKAADCAGAQKKFWPFNDVLFGTQETQPAENINLEKLSDQLHMDFAKLLACMKSAKTIKRISEQIHEANNLHIPGTPTYYVGAQPYPGGIPEQTLQKILKKRR